MEKLLNNPALNPFSNPATFTQMKEASGLSMADMIAYASGKKRNTKKEDEERSRRRVEQLDQ